MHTVLHRALKNSLSKETSLIVLLNVFLFDCSSINSSNGNSRGTKREAEAMFSKHKLRAGAVFETARLGSHLSALL